MFLFRVNGKGRLTASLLGLDPLGDVLELGVAVGVLFAFPCLPIRLEAVTLRLQQLTNFCVTYLVTLLLESLGQRACAFACPLQRQLRISTRTRVDYRFQRFDQSSLLVFSRSAATAFSALAIRRKTIGIIQFLDAGADRPVGYARRSCDCSYTSPSEGACLDRRPASPPALVQLGNNGLILFTNPSDDLCFLHP